MDKPSSEHEVEFATHLGFNWGLQLTERDSNLLVDVTIFRGGGSYIISEEERILGSDRSLGKDPW